MNRVKVVLKKGVALRKKYVIINLSAVCLVLLASLSLVLVLASINPGVSTKIMINYSAKDVEADIQANYKVGESNAVSMGSITITPDGENGNLITPESITLNSENNRVVFEYIVTNKGDRAFKLDCSYTGDNANVNITYGVRSVRLSGDGYSTITNPELATQLVLKDTSTDINNPDRLYIYIVATKESNISNVDFRGMFNLSLEKVEDSDLIEITHLSLDGAEYDETLYATVGSAVALLRTLPVKINCEFNGFQDSNGVKYINAYGEGLVELTQENINAIRLTAIYISEN